MKRHFFISLLVSICCFCMEATAQKLKFVQLGIEAGLPANEVYNLHQDKKGYIWAFTEYGIVKHNGTRFIPVCKNLPFEESAVYAVRESPTQEMYIANSKAHIYKIRNDSAFFIKGIEAASREVVNETQTLYDLLIDDSSNIWFSSFARSYKLEHSGNRLIPLSERYMEDSVGVMYKKIGKSYFYIKLPYPFSDNDYLKVTDEQDNTLFKIRYPNRVSERAYIREKNGNFYFLTHNEVIRRDPQGNISRTTFKETTIVMEMAPNGHIWVGSRRSLHELSSDLKPLNSYFGDVSVSDILFDRQGGMWISTIEKGVFYCKSIYTNYYENIPELSSNISMLKKIGNKLFISTTNGELFVQENELLKKINLNTSVFGIKDIIFYNGNYIVGSQNTLLTLDEDLKLIDEGKSFIIMPTHETLNCYDFEDNPGDTLIYLTSTRIVKKYKSAAPFILIEVANKTRSILSRPTDLLVGTMRGLFVCDQTFHIPGYLKILEDKRITTLKKDEENNIWICTKGSGLYILKPDNKLITVKNVPADVVNSISFLNRNTILLSTNKGLYVAGCKGTTITSSWRLLYDNEISSAEEYKGELYIATKQGLITMDRKRLYDPGHSFFYLESVSVNDKKIDCSNIRLPHSENDLYFNFDILEYEKNDLSFYYELSGPYSDKGKVNGTTLHLQNLQPGSYVLLAYLLDANHEKKNILYIPICIQPAFWQTRSFIVEIVIVLISICVFFTGFFYDRQRKKQEQKTMVTRLIVEQRLTALKAQINPHFISNSLTAIQQLMLENSIDKVSRYIAKFSLLIRYTLNYSDKPAACLSNEIDIIDLNIELEKLRFSDKFIFKKEIGSNVDVHALFIPPLITQPLIENAIWHGLLPLKNHRIPTLILKIDIISGKLIISIIDNGVGRQKQDSAIGNNRESKGTWLVSSRIKNLNRLHPNAQSELRIMDLVNENGRPAGTQADLIFPLTVLDELYDESNESYNYRR